MVPTLTVNLLNHELNKKNITLMDEYICHVLLSYWEAELSRAPLYIKSNIADWMTQKTQIQFIYLKLNFYMSGDEHPDQSDYIW